MSLDLKCNTSLCSNLMIHGLPGCCLLLHPNRCYQLLFQLLCCMEFWHHSLAQNYQIDICNHVHNLTLSDLQSCVDHKSHQLCSLLGKKSICCTHLMPTFLSLSFGHHCMLTNCALFAPCPLMCN